MELNWAKLVSKMLFFTTSTTLISLLMEPLIVAWETRLNGLWVSIKLIFKSMFLNELLAHTIISINLPPTQGFEDPGYSYY